MSNSKKRNNARIRGRQKCTRCGTKKVKIVHRDATGIVYECTRESCGIKFAVSKRDPQVKMRLVVKPNEKTMAKEEIREEDKKIIESTPADAEKIFDMSGF